MLEIREAIVVEGRYDKIALEPVVKTSIFTTDGFQIFSDKKKISLLRRVAESRGLIVFTDSDGAGLLIRSRLRSCIDAKYLKHAYIPDVPGKERRKRTASKAGTLGVEGMPPALLEEALRRAGATFGAYHPNPVTKAELFALGLSGGRNSAARRKKLQRVLGLPENLSANALLEAINSLYTREEFSAAAAALQEQGGKISGQKEPGGV